MYNIAILFRSDCHFFCKPRHSFQGRNISNVFMIISKIQFITVNDAGKMAERIIVVGHSFTGPLCKILENIYVEKYNSRPQ